MSALRCTRCDLALPEGIERCPRCLRTSTVVDPSRARERRGARVGTAPARDDDPESSGKPLVSPWWMVALIVLAQAGLGLGVMWARQAQDGAAIGEHPENGVIRWIVAPFFLAVMYGVRAVTGDWGTAGIALLVALIGPLMLSVAAVVTAHFVLHEPSGVALSAAGIGGTILSLVLAGLWAYFTSRARARRALEE